LIRFVEDFRSFWLLLYQRSRLTGFCIKLFQDFNGLGNSSLCSLGILDSGSIGGLFVFTNLRGLDNTGV
jgi:hypothetical protein